MSRAIPLLPPEDFFWLEWAKLFCVNSMVKVKVMVTFTLVRPLRPRGGVVV
jgi:hypothetical protein